MPSSHSNSYPYFRGLLFMFSTSHKLSLSSPQNGNPIPSFLFHLTFSQWWPSQCSIWQISQSLSVTIFQFYWNQLHASLKLSRDAAIPHRCTFSPIVIVLVKIPVTAIESTNWFMLGLRTIVYLSCFCTEEYSPKTPNQILYVSIFHSLLHLRVQEVGDFKVGSVVKVLVCLGSPAWRWQVYVKCCRHRYCNVKNLSFLFWYWSTDGK